MREGMTIIMVDGSHGEGGGQILRSALTLSMATGTPFKMENIRAKRKQPGLMRQHLTAVQAAQAVCGGQVEGAAVGSTELTFLPGPLQPGDYHFSVGTAGSTTLVLQTILPALALAHGPSFVTLEGGTHNPMSPPFDFLERTFLPVFQQMGPRVEAKLERRGFYPAGGGKIRVAIEPTLRLGRLDLLERGTVHGHRATAVVSALPKEIAEREIQVLETMLGWEPGCFQAEVVRHAIGPGNVVTIDIESEQLTEVFVGFGQKGVLAEDVARQVAEEVREYLAAGVPVGRHLADQLLIPMALGEGGSFRTLEPTPHTWSQIELMKQFLDQPVDVRSLGGGEWEIRVGA